MLWWHVVVVVTIIVFLLVCKTGVVIIEVPWFVILVLVPSPVGMSLGVSVL